MADALPAPSVTRRPVVRSIRWRLPLLVSAFVAAIFVLFLSVAYREVSDALLRAAGEHVQGAPATPVDQEVRGIVEDMALVAALFVALAGLASAAVTSRIVRPLTALTQASEAIAAGDFGRRVPEGRPDEIGRLGAAFNAMVTRLRDGQDRLVERAGQATCLAKVATAVTESGALADAMVRCAAAVVEHVPAAHATIWTVNAADGALDRQASAGQSSPFNSGAYDRVREGDGEVGRVARARSPIVTDRIAAHPDARSDVWSTHPELAGVAIFPLVVNEQLVGVLAICATAAFSDRTRESLASIARAIAVGIARKQLEDSRTQLAGILDAASDFVTIGRPAGPPTYLNRAVRRALEMTDDERIESLLAFRPAGFHTFFEDVVLATADRDGSWSGESEYISRSGRVIPVSQVSVAHRDASGRVAYLSTIARDISDQRRTQIALRESEARFRRIAETITEVFWMADVDLGRMAYVSPAYERIWGRTCESLYQDPRSFLEAVHEADRDHVLATLVLQTQGHPFDHEYRIVRPDGEIRWIWDRGFPVRDAAGLAGQYVGSAQDITERKRAEDQLRQSQKMEAVGQLAGGIAHDFNNLLTAIHGYAELLARGMPESDPRRGDLDEIRQAAERATSLTRQLLAFSRKQILAPQVLRLGDVVRELTPMLCRLLGEAIDVKTVVADQGLVKADTSQLEQVLINLAVNSRDAMPNGGHLTIETADVMLDEEYSRQHAGVRPGPHVVLAVSDSGHGMDAATERRVFEPFFTTKPPGQGTGLGLATVHGVVTQSGGHILVYSEPGRGTTFKVYLPRTAEADVVVATGSVDVDRFAGYETILLVEDEGAVREFARRVLASQGYSVHALGDPARALEFAQTNHRSIHLVLTDVVLPGMNGREMAEQLESHHPESRVLFMSGYTDDAIVRDGVLEAGTRFLQKPFTADALLTKVRHVLDE